MPNLNDHGLGGGGKALGVPVYPFEIVTGIIEGASGTIDGVYGANMITTPPENIQGQASCQMDNEMYFIGTASNDTHCFKYNLISEMWSQLPSSTYTGTKEWAVSVGTDIYYAVNNKIIKYNTLTNSHASCGTFRYFAGSKATTDGEYIYISGGNYSEDYYKTMNRFNPTTYEFITLSNIPIDMYDHGCVCTEYGEIFLFNAYQYSISGGDVLPVTRVIRYTITSDSYTVMSDINNFAYTKGMITILNGYIYLINSSYSEDMYNSVCIYDYKRTMKGTILSNSPNGRYSGHVGVIDNVVYMIGGGDTDTDSVVTGDEMTVIKGTTNNVSVQLICRGAKVFTDGDVIGGNIIDLNGKYAIYDIVTLEKSNGSVRIPTDGKYAIVGSSYATIGG